MDTRLTGDPTIGATDANRPTLMGTRHMASAGHYLAAHAAFQILEAGGNAIDAGVAAGLVIGVVQCDIVNVSGVAPILVYDAASGQVQSISGLGYWPKLADVEVFRREYGGLIPHGLLRAVVPSAPEAWITALAQFGTMSFGEVAGAAIRFAGEGFPVYQAFADAVLLRRKDYARWPSNAAIYLPGGNPPRVGEIFKQTELAASLQYMVDQERTAASKGRVAGLTAARDAFYRGDIAKAIVKYHRENGGWMREDDLADFHVEIEPAVRYDFHGVEVYTCPPWCQGPALLQALSLLEPQSLIAMGHNSAPYLHTLVEAMKLALADRERWYGDPRFVDVPLERLLSAEYAAQRRLQIDPDHAFPEMPPDGDGGRSNAKPTVGTPEIPPDTSYVCVVDKQGNVFSATPSDSTHMIPVIPGTGLCPSGRGLQSWTEAGHASCVAPGKRPRLTPNPAIAVKRGDWVMPFGTPGGDVQTQAMLQAFLNVALFGMEPQVAIEKPRLATYSFPSSFQPHKYYPNWLCVEGRIPREIGDELIAKGHDLTWWPDWTRSAGAICMIKAYQQTGLLTAGADPRRPSYAVGW